MNVKLKSSGKDQKEMVVNWDNVLHANEVSSDYFRGQSPQVEITFVNGRVIYINETLEGLYDVIKTNGN